MDGRARETSEAKGRSSNLLVAPSISLPRGGGAIRGVGEKFTANSITGTGSMKVPVALSPGRSGFGPQLSLAYDSGSGNGPFGFGWNLSLPAITRKTDKGLPQYRDTEDSDVFILSGTEDLVPAYRRDNAGNWIRDAQENPVVHEDVRDGYRVRRYRPRIEGQFARIERWTSIATGETHWRSITRDNVTTLYGNGNDSRIFDPDDPTPASPKRVFSWLISASFDDKGNAIIYQYAGEDDGNVDHSRPDERNRLRTANRYLKRIKYGNRTPNRDPTTWKAFNPAQLPADGWMFEIVFDYGEGHYAEDPPDSQGRTFAHARVDAPPGSRWPIRQDPFSSYRAGFEVRTCRLCRRVLMFHHFPQELGVRDCLVRATELAYSESPTVSCITGITQAGFVRQPAGDAPERYLKKSFPPLEFEYSRVPEPQELAVREIRDVDAKSLENLPVGLDGAVYQWVDLDGEGTSGIFTEQADAWYYKRNLSPGNTVHENGDEHAVAMFGPAERVADRPIAETARGARFLDLAGDGKLDVVQMEGPVRGFYERTADAGWDAFQPFTSWSELDTRAPDLKFIDLTGDGHADILITGDDKLTWYPSLGEKGFGPAVHVPLPSDEEKGPRLVFSDGTQSIYLADMSGDGLSDIMRIRNGDICYWPNLGYGQFGGRVTMNNAPWFDNPDQFDQRRIRLADIDGSGTTDIFYLGHDGIYVFYNQSGNGWSDRIVLPQFAAVDNASTVQVLDLLGNGTSCLVWSSPLPAAAPRPMRYLALMDEKPHLIVGVRNNLGAETRVHYSPSTKFYLNDKLAGRPWVTRLSFPVHVVEKVETYDHVSHSRFVSRYAYHHGYFDGEEREFRGFGMVEQWDTELYAAFEAGDQPEDTANVDEASHVPPILTRTWFHTGACLESGRISRQFIEEYYHEGDASLGETGLTPEQQKALFLEDTVMPPDDLTTEEFREAHRALKGSVLRQEVFSRDATEQEDRPYSVSERNYTIELLQPRGRNRHAVFFTHPRETLEFHYDRHLHDIEIAGQNVMTGDPRVSHTMVLSVDEYGNTERSVAISYRRRAFPDVQEPEQKQTHIILTASRFANHGSEADWYRTGVPVETRTYEVVKPPEPPMLGHVIKPFGFGEMVSLFEGDGTGLFPIERTEPEAAKLWPYEKWDWRRDPASAPADTRLRLIEHVRMLYRPDDLGTAANDPATLLPPGDVQSMALQGESYQLAFTPGLLAEVFRRPRDAVRPPGAPPPENLLPAPAGVLSTDRTAGKAADRGGYIDLDGDGNWWIPSGRMFFSPGSDDGPAQELAQARQHFFLSRRYRDPFHTDMDGTDTFVNYDAYDLLVTQVTDPLNNIMRAHNDYRVLQPWMVIDPNRNGTAAAFDALGLVAATATMGKEGENRGDLLEDFETDPSLASLQSFMAYPRLEAASLLGKASTRIVYDLERYRRAGQPPFAATLARETHHFDPLPPGGLKIQVSFSYSDGFGREVQKKIQAEPGEAPQRRSGAPLPSGDIVPGEIITDAQGRTVQADTPHRWLGSGRTVYNNKGKAVRQYEPFFSATHLYESEHDMTDTGVSLVMFYDPIERVVATLHPNHTYEKVVFEPWRQEMWDVNDTVTLDPRNDVHIRGFFVRPDGTPRLPEAEYLPTWYNGREGGALGQSEQHAARQAALHAGTPSISQLDTLGRSFLNIVHNRYKYGSTPSADPPMEEQHETRFVFDAEGNQREVIDTKKRTVMRYDYDMLANRIHQASMEAGERWMLDDAAGNPIRAWDSRGFLRRMTYDKLRRPVGLYVRENGTERLAEGTVYGESRGDSENHLTRVYQVRDGAGLLTNDSYDFKGNLLQSGRRLLADYMLPVDWNTSPVQQGDLFTTSTTFDALNRPLTVTTPDGSTYRAGFNEANLLEKVDVNLRASAMATPFVTNIDYNAKGQRELIAYGNGATATYTYDPLTFRLTNLKTTRPAGVNGTLSQLFADPTVTQDLVYTYDPTGNITRIEDRSLKSIIYDNGQVDPVCDYTYDALYRLIEAAGREHIGQTAFQLNPPDGNRRDHPFAGLADFTAHSNNLQQMRACTERYEYDSAGNIDVLRHFASGGDWTRRYDYDEDSLIRAGEKSNRLTRTRLGNGLNHTESYTYKDPQGTDVHGCMTAVNGMKMTWDFEDQLQRVDMGGGGTAYYVYDAAGQRVRKVIHRQNGTRQKERIYLGNYEIYREYDGAGCPDPTLERETLHVTDDKRRIAVVETLMTEDSALVDEPKPAERYQFGNHLGSASVELDGNGALISYEEYHPYGTTAFQAGRTAAEVSLKRYRYGKERDEETGLYYHGARYYAPWLGRWTSCDPAGLVDGVNCYCYCGLNPILNFDSGGTQSQSPESNLFIGPTIRFDLHGIRFSPSSFESDKGMNLLSLQEPQYRKSVFVGEPGEAVLDVEESSYETAKTTKEERSFFSRGGGSLLAGAAGIGLGALILLSGPVGWIGGLIAGMSIAGGVAGVGVGSAQLALSYSGQTTAKMDRELNEATSTAMMLSSPEGLGGGLAGAAIGGDVESVRTGALVGGLAGASGSAALGLGRMTLRELKFSRLYAEGSYSWKFSRRLKPAIREAFGEEASAARRTNELFNWRGQPTEFMELSHFVPQRLTLNYKSIFNRPWNLKPMWGTEHALVDPQRWQFMTKGFKAAHEGLRLRGVQRFLRLAPDWMQNVGLGVGSGMNLKLRLDLAE